MKKGYIFIEFLIGILAILMIISWCMNLYKFTQLDFEAPYKAEIIRGAGVICAPCGGIMGVISISDDAPVIKSTIETPVAPTTPVTDANNITDTGAIGSATGGVVGGPQTKKK